VAAVKGQRKQEQKMAGKDKSFEELVKEAPAAPAAGTVSLVGTLAQSSEAGKFVLTLQDGSTVTLETAAVEGHEVLGTSVGQTIVRVDVAAEKIPPTSPTRVSDLFQKPFKDPGSDTFPSWTDIKDPALDRKSQQDPKEPILDKPPWRDAKSPLHDVKNPRQDLKEPYLERFTPFALATPHQVPASIQAALEGGGQSALGLTALAFDRGTVLELDLGTPFAFDHGTLFWVDHGTPTWVDHGTAFEYDHKDPWVDSGATGSPRFPD
jgi:hypothetical protein